MELYKKYIEKGSGVVPEVEISADFVVIGAGPAGMGAAVMAARSGIKVALINDRPCLGGNMSKEKRVPPVGAQQYAKNFLYRRETGPLEDLVLYNLHFNPQQNVEMWDLSMMSFIFNEPNIDLYQNVSINNVVLSKDECTILSVSGYCSQTEQQFTFKAPFFADCTGNATVGFLAKAPFLRWCEGKEEFHEEAAPDHHSYHENGCTIYLSATEEKEPVEFHQPSWVKYHFNVEDLKNRQIDIVFRRAFTGFWWIECGGMQDTVYEMREINFELLHIVYAVWDFLKNRSPLKDELRNFNLGWVGSMPGRRENRRLVGDYILTQNDVDEMVTHYDSVVHVGGSRDEHFKEGIFNKEYGNTHHYMDGPFEIPLRCLYSCKLNNMFMAGRNYSATHLAFCSSRNEYGCFQMGQAIGGAAVACLQNNLLPREIAVPDKIELVHKVLEKQDHTILSIPYIGEGDIAKQANISVSSVLPSPEITRCDGLQPVTVDCGYLFPLCTDYLEKVEITAEVTQDTTLSYAFYSGHTRKHSTLPKDLIKEGVINVARGGKQVISIPADFKVTQAGWHFLIIRGNPDVSLYYGNYAPVGLEAMFKCALSTMNRPATVPTNFNRPWDYILDYQYKPSYCIRLFPEQPLYGAKMLINGYNRPTYLPNLWISQETDFSKPETIELSWNEPKAAKEVQIIFDSMLDEFLSVFVSDGNFRWDEYKEGDKVVYNTTYRVRSIPSLVKDYRIYVKTSHGAIWKEVVSVTDNYLRNRCHALPDEKITDLKLEILSTNGFPRAQVYSIRVYEK